MKALINLVQIKKLIALALTLVFCILALRRDISAEQFITVFASVTGFYFGASATRQAVSKE